MVVESLGNIYLTGSSTVVSAHVQHQRLERRTAAAEDRKDLGAQGLGVERNGVDERRG